jgi:hypothetical protein
VSCIRGLIPKGGSEGPCLGEHDHFHLKLINFMVQIKYYISNIVQTTTPF